VVKTYRGAPVKPRIQGFIADRLLGADACCSVEHWEFCGELLLLHMM
jgi:hypothetical protein